MYGFGLLLRAVQRLKERRQEVEMERWALMNRQKDLASAMHRRDNGEEAHPDDAGVLKEAEEAPWFYGLDVPPPSGLTGQGLVRCINRQGGLGSSSVVLGDL